MRSSFKALVSKTAITRWLKKEHTIFVLISNAKFKQLPQNCQNFKQLFHNFPGMNKRSQIKQIAWGK